MNIMAKIIRLTGDDYTKFMQNRNGERARWLKDAWDSAPIGAATICGPNGRTIGRVRQDPGEPEAIVTDGEEVSEEVAENQQESIKRQKNTGLTQRAPSPKACQCSKWPWDEREIDERGKPKSHHPKCAWNKAWLRQKGQAIKQVPATQSLVPTIHKQSAPKNTSVVGPRLLGSKSETRKLKEKIEQIPLPEKCSKCSHFTKSKKMDPALHHPTCVYFKKHKAIYEAQQKAGVKPEPQAAVMSKNNKPYLFDLQTMTAVREAEADEVAEARQRLTTEGVAFASVDDKDYLVAFQDGTTLEPEPAVVEPETADTVPPAADVESEDAEAV